MVNLVKLVSSLQVSKCKWELSDKRFTRTTITPEPLKILFYFFNMVQFIAFTKFVYKIAMPKIECFIGQNFDFTKASDQMVAVSGRDKMLRVLLKG